MSYLLLLLFQILPILNSKPITYLTNDNKTNHNLKWQAGAPNLKKKKKSMKPNSKSTAEQYNYIRNLIK